MVECMIGEKEAKKLDMIPVSNNTVSRRIDAMSEDILATLISRVKKSEFYSLQVDESTDVANLANLLLYIRYLFLKEWYKKIFCSVGPLLPERQDRKSSI